MTFTIQQRQPLYPPVTQVGIPVPLFRQPPAAYRGAPFWAWNGPLHEDQLIQQIHMFKEMGMGGFHIHPRTGLATSYLGAEFMALVQRCVTEAEREGLRVWLYDEDRWPSGAAGGIVTREPQYRARHLLFTPFPYGDETGLVSLDSSARARRTGNGTLVARYAIHLQEDGTLGTYKRLDREETVPDDATVWYAYLETAIPSPWFNDQTYVDTLNPAAIRRFIEVTHEQYAAVVGDAFGTTIPAIFTDEPQFPHKEFLAEATEQRDLILPCTGDFFATYAATYGQQLEDMLPEVIWDLPRGQASVARYRYHDHICERFTRAYSDQIGAWCAEHGLRLTGHMMEEPTLGSQTAALGEAMRAYRSFQLPGIDILFDWQELTTAKQAQSAARQYGREGVLSELYGVTNWDFDFIGHKAQGDWQAALGVTVRVHHLAWLSMAGEAKRDYPASISYQSPWWHEYPLVEDHFARINTALTRGQAVVRVGVIHPIESYWLCSGPLAQTRDERAMREQSFVDVTRWLLFGLVDFDFIAESLLPDLCPEDAAAPMAVGEGAYEVIIVPGLRTLRRTTFVRLQAFHAAGGRVIFAGEIPTLLDAQPTEEVQHFAVVCQHIPMISAALLESVASVRDFEALRPDGTRPDVLLYQLRADGDDCYLFCCNTDRQQSSDDLDLSLQGIWEMTLLDTVTGEQHPLPVRYHDGTTHLTYSLLAHGSLLVQLTPGRAASVLRPLTALWREAERFAAEVPITLAEPNVLLLDYAAYQLDDGPWQPAEEILRLDNTLRRQLGWPLRMEAIAQPWTKAASPHRHTLRLRFTIDATVHVAVPHLALEDVGVASISLDGQPVPTRSDGWFVDQSISTVALPDLLPGQHRLDITMPYGPSSNPEWCYLLGDFGVTLTGTHAQITAPIRSLLFGDWTQQGLPFYAGNVTYHTTFTSAGESLAVEVADYRAPVLSVTLDDRRIGPLAFAPYRLDLGEIAPGAHALAITAYGNRVNAFGPLHNATPGNVWVSPNAWRTVGDAWTDAYRLTPMGIMQPPRLLIAEWH